MSRLPIPSFFREGAMTSGRTTVMLPAAGPGWEIWRCGGRSGESVREGSADDLPSGTHGQSRLIVALPARSCRTFAFAAPTPDRQLLRKLAFAQVEKRGLTVASAEQTPFNWHLIGQSEGRSLVSVDVVAPEAAASLTASKAAAAVPNSRLYPLPDGRLVIIEEQGRLVLCAGCGGRLVHTQIVSATRELSGFAAPEIRITCLALRQHGIVPEITGVELWGDFARDEADELSAELDLPVVVEPRPVPDSSAVRREAGVQLLPPAARQALRGRRLLRLRWVGLAVLSLFLLGLLFHEKRKLWALEAEAARIEAALNIPGAAKKTEDDDRIRAEHDFVTAAQERWSELRMALEPRRYPAAHLNGLSRCLTAADVVLTRFETKVSELTVSGTARSAMDAYNYFNAVNKDEPLGVYSWSMLPPLIGADGSAAFEIKGKMR